MAPRIITKAKQLRLEYQYKLGRDVTVLEVAQEAEISRAQLSEIERGLTNQIRFDTLIKLCGFYTGKLGRPIGVSDLLEYDPNNKKAFGQPQPLPGF